MKKRVAWGLAIVGTTLVYFVAPASSQRPYSDVPSEHQAYEAINDLTARGLVNGYPSGSFAGQRPLTRYEFAVAAQRLIQYPGRYDVFGRLKPPSKPRGPLPVLSPPFPDVPKVHWAREAVEEVREKGIVAGFSDGTFRGRRLMNRNEVSIAIRRLCAHFVGRLGNEPRGGLGPLQFDPGTRMDQPISRYESAVVFHQALGFYLRAVEASVEPGS